MRVRITWHVVARGRDEVRIPADVLRREARSLMEALIDKEEAGQIKNPAVETDADVSSVTAEAVLTGADTRAAIGELKSLAVTVFAIPRLGVLSEWTLEFREEACVVEAIE